MVATGNAISMGGNTKISANSQSMSHEMFSAGFSYNANGTAQVSMSDNDIRVLANNYSNTSQLSFSTLYSKAAPKDYRILTVGYQAPGKGQATEYGFDSALGMGSLSPNSTNFKLYGGTASIMNLWTTPDTNATYFILSTNTATNSGWTTLQISNSTVTESFSRAAATFANGATDGRSTTWWTWANSLSTVLTSSSLLDVYVVWR